MSAGLAASQGTWPAGDGIPVAGVVRDPALRVRPGDARGAVAAAPRVQGQGAGVVDGRTGHPVLAPLRAPAAARAGTGGRQLLRPLAADERAPALLPARGTAPVLQLDRV